MRSPVIAANMNTIHRSSSALRYLPNLSYQAMVTLLPGRMIEPTAAAVNWQKRD